jgi:sensor domain CHASE-containing protein
MAGWHLHLLALVQLSPTLAPMQYNSAICFALIGIAMVALGSRQAPWLSPLLGTMAAIFGALALAEDLFQRNLGIDELFLHSYVTMGTSHPGRMSPVSSACFLAIGLALLLLRGAARRKWRLLAAGTLASLTISVVLVALIGYGLGLHNAYAWGQLTDIAIQSAGGIMVVGAALFYHAWNAGLEPGERTPRWLPVPLVLGILSATVVLYAALDAEQNLEISQTVKAGAESVKNQVSVRIDARIRSFVRMAQRWELAGGTPKPAWESDAADYVHDFPDLQALEWIDATHHVRWIVPLAGNESKLGLDLTQEAHRKAAVEEAEQEHQPVITPIVSLFRGGAGCVVYVPLRVNGKPDGFITAILKAQTCLDRYLPPAVASGEALEFSDNGKVFYQRDATTPPLREDWTAEEKVEMHGATWTFRIWPTPALARHLCSPLPQVILIAGMLGSLLLGMTCYFAQRCSRHAIESDRKNTALEEALQKVRTLEGLLPICSYCKRVREDTGYWSQIDTYLGEHTNASLSHGYCPECAANAFKEFGLEVPESVTSDLEAGKFEPARRLA